MHETPIIMEHKMSIAVLGVYCRPPGQFGPVREFFPCCEDCERSAPLCHHTDHTEASQRYKHFAINLSGAVCFVTTTDTLLLRGAKIVEADYTWVDRRFESGVRVEIGAGGAACPLVKNSTETPPWGRP